MILLVIFTFGCGRPSINLSGSPETSSQTEDVEGQQLIDPPSEPEKVIVLKSPLNARFVDVPNSGDEWIIILGDVKLLSAWIKNDLRF